MEMSESKPVGGKIFTSAFAVAFLFALVGGWFLVQRFAQGIGAVTGLSDGFPWGLWITFDVVVGTALGCGGFAMAILVYILNKGEYHPLVRSAIMTSLFGYTLAAVAVFIDIGRYWNMHHTLLPQYWNTSSVLLEVAVCIALYVAVLWIEFTPAFLEKGGGPQASKGINKVMFIFIALGVLLPTMHQSSLGTLMVISGYKLSPLWQTGLLPLLFLVTAVAMGYAVTAFESILSSVIFGRPLEMKLLSRLSGIIPALICFFLVLRVGDLVVRGAGGEAFGVGWKPFMFWVENLLFLVPAVLLASRSGRQHAETVCFAAFSLLLAGAVYRFNTYLVGFSPGPGWKYFPTAPEIFITLGIVSVEIMAYLIFVKALPVLPEPEHA
jgi:Ni/Fe-hydrogenase subunit HybB-like protein